MTFRKNILLLSITIFLINNSWAEKSIGTNPSTTKDSLNLNFLSPNHISLTDSVVNYGKLFLNTPYHYGSTGSDSFDCSGFTSYVYNNFGYNLQRNSAEQAQQFDTIDRCQLKTGDLVFFSGRGRSKKVGHVGIVVAAKENGEFDFIHSAVRTGVTISNSTEPYYTKRFIKANRVIGYNPMLAVNQPVANVSETKFETPTLIPFSGNVQKTEKIIPAEYHRVKKGETLSSIAQKFGITVTELKENNDLKRNKITRNQELLVKVEESIMVVEPARTNTNNTKIQSEKPQKSEITTPEQVGVLATTHIVKKGESLFSISKLVNLSIDDLKKINNLNSGKVNAGQELIVSLPTELTKDAKNQIAENNSKPITHKVEKGESLIGISKAFHISVADLKKLNDLNDNKIQIGQEIKIVDTKELAEVTVKSSKNKSTKESVHKVTKGESLYSIAEDNNMSIEDLKQINHLTTNQIKYGQKIMIIAENEQTDASKTPIVKSDDHKGETKDLAEVSVKSSKNKSTKESLHKVIKGESLYSIAEDNNMSIEELKQINNLSKNQLKFGQTIKVLAVIEQVDTKGNTKIKSKNTDIAEAPVKDSKNKQTKESVHKVIKGESLYSIATDNNMSIEDLKQINKLSTNQLKYGQTIKIIAENEQVVATSIPNTKTEDTGIIHNVISGESYFSIAKTYSCSIDNLKEWNKKSSNKIKVGDKLIIHQNNI